MKAPRKTILECNKYLSDRNTRILTTTEAVYQSSRMEGLRVNKRDTERVVRELDRLAYPGPVEQTCSAVSAPEPHIGKES